MFCTVLQQTDAVISQAQSTLGALSIQRSMFGGINSKIGNVGSRLPIVCFPFSWSISSNILQLYILHSSTIANQYLMEFTSVFFINNWWCQDQNMQVNNVLTAIKRRKSLDTIIISVVASICTFLIFIYWLSK